MKQEDKKLLFRYLSMALPYGIVVETQLINAPRAKYPVLKVLQSYMLCDFMQNIENVIHKPYLRPLASMTEEELVELNCLCYHNISVQDDMLCGYICGIEIDDVQNFLLHYHFDFMGLIPRDLAIAVTEENNPYNTTEE